jgi:hypothetical protein
LCSLHDGYGGRTVHRSAGGVRHRRRPVRLERNHHAWYMRLTNIKLASHSAVTFCFFLRWRFTRFVTVSAFDKCATLASSDTQDARGNIICCIHPFLDIELFRITGIFFHSLFLNVPLLIRCRLNFVMQNLWPVSCYTRGNIPTWRDTDSAFARHHRARRYVSGITSTERSWGAPMVAASAVYRTSDEVRSVCAM